MSKGFVVKGGGETYERAHINPTLSGISIYHGTATPQYVQTREFTIPVPFIPKACLFEYTPTFTFQSFEGITYFENFPSVPYVPDSGQVISLSLNGIGGFSQKILNMSYRLTENAVTVTFPYTARGNTKIGSLYAYFIFNTIILG